MAAQKNKNITDISKRPAAAGRMKEPINASRRYHKAA
jgi:hypothetical protein